MADFCYQCTRDILGVDDKVTIDGEEVQVNDFIGLCSLVQNKGGLYSTVLCEGCGGIQVNYLGQCVSTGCIKNHKDGKLFHLGETK